MPRDSDLELVYPIAERFCDECLVRDSSPFNPGKEIGTPETIGDFTARLFADTSSASFDTKLRRQLDGAPFLCDEHALGGATITLLHEPDHLKQTTVRVIGACHVEPRSVPIKDGEKA